MTADDLIRDLERAAGSCCVDCGASVCPHQVLMCIALGFKGALRCGSCLARGLGSERTALRDQLARYFDQKECYRGAWAWAGEREGAADPSRPDCLWTGPERRTGSIAVSLAEAGDTAPVPPDGPGPEWDAGDMGCGDLVLELRTRLLGLKGGEVLRVTARDPGAPEDLPAWCRMTGHPMVRAEHPHYWIRRKG